MSVQVIKRVDQAAISLDGLPLERLRKSLLGAVLTPESKGYDQARTVWNAMIDRRPALILQCADAGDVQRSVEFAHQHELLTAVRGGGHNIGGFGVCDGGLVIDLTRMRHVEVDPETRRAKVQGGALLGDFDSAAQAHALIAPLGINSTTGVGGLTLGGGFGWLTRKFGLTIDCLRSAEVVTADGRLLHASADENPELFWAIRGGGGNFGIVTSFEFRLQPLGPQVASGMIFHPFTHPIALLEQYRGITSAASDALTVWTVMRHAPPLPFLPAAVHGQMVLIFVAVYAGPVEEGLREMAPLRAIGTPIADVIGPNPFLAHQQAFDPLLSFGSRNYWKTNNFLTLSDALIETLVTQAERMPFPTCELFLGHLGGAVQRVPDDATAYAMRNANYVMNVHGRWDQPAQDAAGIEWARDTFRATTPFATGGMYVNFLTQDDAPRIANAYGPLQHRLELAKRQYDPDNFFRMNQNIAPAAHA